MILAKLGLSRDQKLECVTFKKCPCPNTLFLLLSLIPHSKPNFRRRGTIFIKVAGASHGNLFQMYNSVTLHATLIVYSSSNKDRLILH